MLYCIVLSSGYVSSTTEDEVRAFLQSLGELKLKGNRILAWIKSDLSLEQLTAMPEIYVAVVSATQDQTF